MPNYRDWEMLNQSITGLGEGFAQRRQQKVINDREAQRIALERELRDTQQQRENRMETEGNRRWDLTERRQTRMEEDFKGRAEREEKRLDMAEKRLDLANAPRVSTTYFDPVTGRKGTMSGPAQAINDYADDYEKHTGKKLQLGEFKAVANVGMVQQTFDDPAHLEAFAADMLKRGIDVYKPVAPTFTKTPEGQEIITTGTGHVIKGAPAPQPNRTTEKTEVIQDPTFPGIAPTTRTNKITTVTGVPRGTSGEQPGAAAPWGERVPGLGQASGVGSESIIDTGRTTPGRAAAKGYKIGARYKGGLIYLGGDVNDPASWDQAER